MTAEASGGFAITNTNDFTKGLSRIIDDLDHYYLLGFYPDDPQGGGYRRLDVKAPTGPADAALPPKLRCRRPPPPPEMPTRSWRCRPASAAHGSGAQVDDPEPQTKPKVDTPVSLALEVTVALRVTSATGRSR